MYSYLLRRSLMQSIPPKADLADVVLDVRPVKTRRRQNEVITGRVNFIFSFPCVVSSEVPQKTHVKTKFVFEKLRVRSGDLPNSLALIAKIAKVTLREQRVAEVNTKYDPH